jgi:hypothetical protein
LIFYEKKQKEMAKRIEQEKLNRLIGLKNVQEYAPGIFSKHGTIISLKM